MEMKMMEESMEWRRIGSWIVSIDVIIIYFFIGGSVIFYADAISLSCHFNSISVIFYIDAISLIYHFDSVDGDGGKLYW
jgi:hypothetical protein